MALEIVDPAAFTSEGTFYEDSFVAGVEQHDWLQYDGKKVLVRGCTSTVIPPWAYMLITGKLSGVARSVRYGNEHDNIVVYRTRKTNETSG